MITAVVLAAGQSSRMGRPKMTMKWGKSTVIASVVESIIAGGVEKIIVITGGAREEVEKALEDFDISFVSNAHYAELEMLESVQLGLISNHLRSEAALIVLGDQPQIKPDVIKKIVQLYIAKERKIIVPSYRMRRGHPWLIHKDFWDRFLKIRSPQTPRSFFEAYQEFISYVNVNTASILQDLDTPDDYEKFTKEFNALM